LGGDTKKQQFLRLSIVEQKKYKDIAQELNVEEKQLSRWWEESKPKREEINKIKQLWTRKKYFKVSFPEFYDWYIDLDKKCYYCGITEENIKKLIDNKLIGTKRLSTRGRSLELEREKPEEPYDNTDNLVLCCYWCNNAKSDEFSEEEFKEIGKVIGKIWQTRLQRIRPGKS
jgi:5-methylcytosine-specific restriction endonuclease McrA